MSKWGRCSGGLRCGMSVGNEPTLVGQALYRSSCGRSLSPRTSSARLSLGCPAHPADTMRPSHRRTTNRKAWTRRWSTMAFPFSSEKTMIDPLILKLETYPQDGGTRPSIAGNSSQLTCHRDKGIIEGDGL